MFMSMLKELSMNIHLVEALEQIPSYSKFMKDVVMKKWTVRLETTDNVHHCSAIIFQSLVKKIQDPIALSTINMMSLLMYKKLGFGTPKLTSMRLLVIDQVVKKQVGI